jgi:hypothetical protein
MSRARDAAGRILAELADDGVTVAAVRDAELALAELAGMVADGVPGARALADALAVALAEIESPEGLGTDGAAALARVAR